MRFAFIAAKKAEHRVTILCRCMRVTRSGFYAWMRRALLSARRTKTGNNGVVNLSTESDQAQCEETL